MRSVRVALMLAALFGGAALAAAAIETEALQQRWPGERAREYEIGRYTVRWRQKADKHQGLFAGVRFTVPRPRQTVWDLANNYSGVGGMTPGVHGVRIVQDGPNRQVIDIDLKVLWKEFTLRFEMEQEPPNAVRFRWADERFGEYLGVARFEEVQGSDPQEAPATQVELSTRLTSPRPIPTRLLLGVERLAMLSAAKEFLKSCDDAK